MQSFDKLVEPKTHCTKVTLLTGGEEDMELKCFDEKNPTLDGITLYINAFIYILQQVCGLKVRTFMVNSMEDDTSGIYKYVQMVDSVAEQIGLDLGPKIPVRFLYMFLNLSTENMLKVASRYEVKKAMDYSTLDFSLNDPTTEDNRPIKYHSRYKADRDRREEFKHLSRFFSVREQNDINTEIIDEVELSLLEEQRFRSYWEESCNVFEFMKTRVGEEISNEEKIYLYEYNRGKINEGCERVLSSLKKRREYFELQKTICAKYEYKVWDDPEFYEEFILPNKDSKGGFFQKLRNILVYKPNLVTPYGDMALFNSMERTKLCYLMLKRVFKINYLQRILQMDLLCLNNEF
jgi:hypothetical protein